uniref:Uncharacterized protein n=1 Tax=Anopheles dirus TaxID=7168 RepID=A0A182NUP8_9DIPT
MDHGIGIFEIAGINRTGLVPMVLVDVLGQEAGCGSYERCRGGRVYGGKTSELQQPDLPGRRIEPKEE